MAKIKSEKTALTDKRELFVQELIKGNSQRTAYRIAYPVSKNWKDSAVDTQASILMANRKVLERYNQLHDRLVKEAEDDCIIDAKRVLQELANIAFANGTDYAKVVQKQCEKVIRDEDGNIVGTEPAFYNDVELALTDELPEDKKKAIACIKNTKFGIAVETCDKVKALELLGKHLKLFTDKVETEVSGNLNNPLADFSTEELKQLLKK